MAIRYTLDERPGIDGDNEAFHKAHESASERAEAPVQIISTEEFDQLPFIPKDAQTELESLEHDRTNFIDIFPEFYLGSLSIPARGKPNSEPELISFYLDSTHLLLITEGDMPQAILDEIAVNGRIPRFDCARCLFYILNQMMMKDLSWLSEVEGLMEDLEERIIANVDKVETKTIIKLRRMASKQGAFYQEIGDIAEVLENDTSDIISTPASRRFGNLASHCDRLTARTETLKEYSMQLHELYETQLNEKQNKIMGIFTVVTVVFAPLTFIVGWYGMNIGLPGAGLEYMWLILLVCSVALSAAIVWFIKHKKWL